MRFPVHVQCCESSIFAGYVQWHLQKISVLSTEISWCKVHKSVLAKWDVNQGVQFPGLLHPICYQHWVFICFGTMLTDLRKQIDSANAIFVSLGKVTLYAGVILGSTFKKWFPANGMVLGVCLVRLLWGFKIPVWFFITLMVIMRQD